MTRGTKTFEAPDPEEPSTSRSPILVLTGERGAGKSSSCARIAGLAAARGWRVAGVLSPALLEEGQKVGILVTDLCSGQTRPLARLNRNHKPGGLAYKFDPSALAWADAAVAASTPCDLLILDELGPLEIEQGRGMVSAFRVLRDGRYRLAVVVVRPSLLDPFQTRLGLPCIVRTIRGLPREAADPRALPVEWFEECFRG